MSQDNIKTDHDTFVADVMLAVVDVSHRSDIYNLPAAKGAFKPDVRRAVCFSNA
jgi:hypothetical protein